jgi:hypothetical protein
MAGLFALMYWWNSGISAPPPGVEEPNSFLDYLHFSFTTQTTLGYGDYMPLSWGARQIVAIQVTLVLALNAVGAGVVAARLVRRRAKIEFAPELAYDRRRHEMKVVIWNRHKDDLCNTDCKIIVRQKMKTGDYVAPVMRSFEVKLRKNVPAYFPSNSVLLAATSSDGGQARRCSIMNPDKASPMSLLSLGENCKIFVVITGNSVTSGGTIVASHEYRIDAIRCGQYERYADEMVASDPYVRFRRFGRVGAATLEDCRGCDIIELCFVYKQRRAAAAGETHPDDPA